MPYLSDKFSEAAELLPKILRIKALALPESDRSTAEEIRLRIGRRASVLLPSGEKAFSDTVTSESIAELLDSATRLSLHSAKESLRYGYITCRGGHRLGICGRAVVRDGITDGFRCFSSVSLRIAREIKDAAEGLCDEDFRSTLILSPPGGGKTTVLRDMIRRLSQRWRVGVADERGEICAPELGVPQFDIGSMTDFIELCPKREAVMLLLKTMNPQIIAMDEITGLEREAVMSAADCGIKLLCTTHGESIERLLHKPMYREMLEGGIFEQLIIITNGLKRTCNVVKTEDILCLKS